MVIWVIEFPSELLKIQFLKHFVLEYIDAQFMSRYKIQ